MSQYLQTYNFVHCVIFAKLVLMADTTILIYLFSNITAKTWISIHHKDQNNNDNDSRFKCYSNIIVIL